MSYLVSNKRGLNDIDDLNNGFSNDENQGSDSHEMDGLKKGILANESINNDEEENDEEMEAVKTIELPNHISISTPVNSEFPPINQMLDRIYIASQEVDISIKLLDMFLLESANLANEFLTKGSQVHHAGVKGQQEIASLQEQIMYKQPSQAINSQAQNKISQSQPSRESPLTMTPVGERQFAQHQQKLMKAFDIDSRTKLYNKMRKLREAGLMIINSREKMEEIVITSNKRFADGEQDRARYWDTFSELKRFEKWLERLKCVERVNNVEKLFKQCDDKFNGEYIVNDMKDNDYIYEPLLLMDEYNIWEELYSSKVSVLKEKSIDTSNKDTEKEDNSIKNKKKLLTDRDILISKQIKSHTKNRLKFKSQIYKIINDFLKLARTRIPIKCHYSGMEWEIKFFNKWNVHLGISDTNASIIPGLASTNTNNNKILAKDENGIVHIVSTALTSKGNIDLGVNESLEDNSISILGTGFSLWIFDEILGKSLKTMHISHLMSVLHQILYSSIIEICYNELQLAIECSRKISNSSNKGNYQTPILEITSPKILSLGTVKGKHCLNVKGQFDNTIMKVEITDNYDNNKPREEKHLNIANNSLLNSQLTITYCEADSQFHLPICSESSSLTLRESFLQCISVFNLI